MGDYKVRVVFGAVRKVVVPVLLGTSYINTFVKDIFLLKWKIVPYKFKLVAILVIKDLSEKHNDKAQDVTVLEKHAPRLVRVARQRKLPQKLEAAVLVAK